jgi:hypothetical protein
MKRKWHNIPSPIDVAGAWLASLFLPTLLIAVLTWHNLPNTATTVDRHELSTAGWIAIIVWAGPIVAGFILYAALCLWDARPRRSWVPLTEDAREAHSKSLGNG